MAKRRALGTSSLGNIFTSIKVTHKNQPTDHHLRNTAVFLHTSSQCLEEEQVKPLHIYRNSLRQKEKPILHKLEKRDHKKHWTVIRLVTSYSRSGIWVLC
jgi:hypothetical protein